MMLSKKSKRWGSSFDVVRLLLLTLLIGVGAGIMVGWIFGFTLGLKECSNDIPHYGLETPDQGFETLPAGTRAPPSRIGRVQGFVDDRAGLGTVALFAVDPHGIVPNVRVAAEPLWVPVGVIPVGFVAPENNSRAGSASPARNLFGEGNLHSASPSTAYRLALLSRKEPLPIPPQLQDFVGEQAAEGRLFDDDLVGIYLILSVLVVSFGLLAAARVVRWIVGRLMDLWGMEC